MSQRDTAVLWDVDGAIAPSGAVRQGLTVVACPWGAMIVDPMIVDVALSLPADHFWFTNRGADEAELITSTLELAPIPVVDTRISDDLWHGDEWPKAAALRRFVADHPESRIVIVDDEMVLSHAGENLAGHDYLLIVPDQNEGVTLDHIEDIRAFIGGGPS